MARNQTHSWDAFAEREWDTRHRALSATRVGGPPLDVVAPVLRPCGRPPPLSINVFCRTRRGKSGCTISLGAVRRPLGLPGDGISCKTGWGPFPHSLGAMRASRRSVILSCTPTVVPPWARSLGHPVLGYADMIRGLACCTCECRVAASCCTKLAARYQSIRCCFRLY